MTSDSSTEQARRETDDLAVLLDSNRSFAEQFKAGDLKIRPRRSTILLTCVDARVDPAHFFGLELGDALVIRTTGGRVNPAVMTDLAVLGVLGSNLAGPGAVLPELVLIHHTDCGMSRFVDPVLQEQVAYVPPVAIIARLLNNREVASQHTPL